MTPDPFTVAPQTPISEVSRLMREHDIGDVLVADDGRLRGLVTDRDLVIRGMAGSRDPDTTTAQDVCSAELISCAPDAEVAEAVRLMREHSVRRLPIVDNGRLVGTVSIGDLAIERDRDSALADISAAAPNR
jgi:CBS domain-containing protein